MCMAAVMRSSVNGRRVFGAVGVPDAGRKRALDVENAKLKQLPVEADFYKEALQFVVRIDG